VLRQSTAPKASADDPKLKDLLTMYHRQGVKSNKKIKEKLAMEGIDIGYISLSLSPLISPTSYSITTIKSRREELGLLGARAVGRRMDPEVLENAIGKHMEQDTAKHVGVKLMQTRLANRELLHVPKCVWQLSL
jgi:hypothetical protein